MIQKRTKRNSSRINLIISVVVHTALILAVFYFAAREGMLGKKLKQLAVTMVKEKPPEPPKPKPPENKPPPPKPEDAPKPAVPPPVQTVAAPPPIVDLAPAVAPAAVSLPSFDFNDGAIQVESISDANGVYKALIEHSVRSHWNRPEDLDDESFVVEVQLTIDAKGRITDSRWVSGSGNKRWDDSVHSALAEAKTVGKPPPKDFPQKFVIRFDVETVAAAGFQLSSR